MVLWICSNARATRAASWSSRSALFFVLSLVLPRSPSVKRAHYQPFGVSVACLHCTSLLARSRSRPHAWFILLAHLHLSFFPANNTGIPVHALQLRHVRQLLLEGRRRKGAGAGG